MGSSRHSFKCRRKKIFPVLSKETNRQLLVCDRMRYSRALSRWRQKYAKRTSDTAKKSAVSDVASDVVSTRTVFMATYSHRQML